jgi:hypothetical protein
LPLVTKGGNIINKYGLFLGLLTLFITEIHAVELCSLTVQVNVFSGRPNPYFIINDTNDLRSISEKIVSITSDANFLIDTPVAYIPKLGYRGLRITKNNGSNIPREFQLFSGILQIGTTDTAKYYSDTGSALEIKLICLGLNAGFIYPDNYPTNDTGIIPIDKRQSCSSPLAILSVANNKTLFSSGITVHTLGARIYVSGAKSLLSSSTLSLFDASGERVAIQQNQGECSFDISRLSNGVYFIRFESAKGIQTAKVIIGICRNN